MRLELYDYQKYCRDHILATPGAGLFLDMGLGKTAITLDAIRILKYERFLIDRVLVIAPKKVAESTWQDEVGKWDTFGCLRCATVLGDQKARIAALNTPADIYIINRDNVAWLVRYYKQDWPFDMVVCDELSGFKNPSAKRFKTLAAVRSKISRFVGLTGTPTASRRPLLDLWSQVYLIDGGAALGDRFTHFRDRYFTAGRRNGYVVYDWVPRPGAREEILQKIGGVCLSMRSEDYITLPPLVVQDIPVTLSGKAKAAYERMERSLVLDLPEGDVSALSAAALSNKLCQLANGAIYDDEGHAHEVHNDKLAAFNELLEGLDGASVLVFYAYKHDLSRLQAALMGLNRRVMTLSGAEEAEAWNRGEVDVLLAHPASCAYGLNLQHGGRHIIWFGLPWSLELYAQANKRLHRNGQDGTVFVHRLVAKGTRDEDIATALAQKSDAQDYVLSSLKARIDKCRLGG